MTVYEKLYSILCPNTPYVIEENNYQKIEINKCLHNLSFIDNHMDIRQRIKLILDNFFPSVLSVLISEYVHIHTIYNLKKDRTLCSEITDYNVCHLINDNKTWTYSYICNVLTVVNDVISPSGWLSLHDICMNKTNTMTEIYVFMHPKIYVLNEECKHMRIINMPDDKYVLYTVKKNKIYAAQSNCVTIYDTYGKYIEKVSFKNNIHTIIPSDNYIDILLECNTIIRCNINKILTQNSIILHNEFGDPISYIRCLCIIDDYFFTMFLTPYLYIHDEDGNYTCRIETEARNGGIIYYNENTLYLQYNSTACNEKQLCIYHITREYSIKN